jgi:FKBP-type peptidyl-prolyl cis-trans isomerase
LALSVAAAVVLGACVDSTGPPFPHIEETEFAPSLGVDLSSMTRLYGGIYVRDVVVGSGAELVLGNFVIVSYTLHLADGTFVHTHDDLRFVMGCRTIVPGLEAGTRGMRVDGIRQIVVPGRLGYGQTPPPDIDVPFGSILVYEVEAIESRRIRELECAGTSGP